MKQVEGCQRIRTSPFGRLRGYLSTLSKQGVTLLAALETLFIGHPLYSSFA